MPNQILVVNIESFRIMDYKNLLGDIINAISQPAASDNKQKETNAEICYKIQQSAVRVGYPFQTFRDQCVYCYTGDVGKSLL